MRVYPSQYVADYKILRRTWRERLFTLPWRPFETHKTITEIKAYISGDHIFVSYHTFGKITKGEMDGCLELENATQLMNLVNESNGVV
jgi:hypothetical protein